MEISWKFSTLWLCLFVPSIITSIQAGISYQSVSFVHSPPKIRHFRPLPQPPSAPSVAIHHPHFPTVFGNQLHHSFAEELWPSSVFEDPVDFLDITLEEHEHLLPKQQHEHDFINELELPPDPYLLTGFRAKQAANYLYSHELFFKDIPHVKALLKLQDKRIANGLRPNRLGSINPRSPFSRERSF